MSHTRSRLTRDDAMTFWRARDVYRVYAICQGILVLFFGLELLLLTSRGYWYVGVLLIGAQLALLWGLRWALRWLARWANRGLWWGLDHAKLVLLTWIRTHRR